jgi:hypothetical protein
LWLKYLSLVSFNVLISIQVIQIWQIWPKYLVPFRFMYYGICILYNFNYLIKCKYGEKVMLLNIDKRVWLSFWAFNFRYSLLSVTQCSDKYYYKKICLYSSPALIYASHSIILISKRGFVCPFLIFMPSVTWSTCY